MLKLLLFLPIQLCRYYAASNTFVAVRNVLVIATRVARITTCIIIIHNKIMYIPLFAVRISRVAYIYRIYTYYVKRWGVTTLVAQAGFFPGGPMGLGLKNFEVNFYYT